MATVMAGPTLARGIRDNFADTWEGTYQTSEEKYGSVMEFGVPTDDYVSLFSYGEPARYPNRIDWGERPDRKPHRYRTFSVPQYRWMNAVEWLVRDRELSNLGTIYRDAQRAGRNFGTLNERVLFQILQSSTDADLLPASLTAPDGVALYSTVDGAGAARFGVTGGNIQSGEDITTGAGMRTAVMNVLERMLQFDDPEGQPALDESLLEKGITVIYPAERLEAWHEAFIQALTSQVISTSNAGVSNYFQDAGINIRGIPSQRLTVATTMYVFVDYYDVKPVFEVASRPVTELYYDGSNSKDYGERGIEGIVLESWRGFGVNLPLSTCQVTT